MRELFIILLLASPMVAQTPKPEEKPKTPVITDAQRADFFKAQSQMIQANQTAQQSQSAFQAQVAILQKACGDIYTVQLNAQGDPECVVKPEPKK